MLGWRKLIAAFVGGLVVCAAVRADMVPVSQLDAEPWQSEQPCSRGESPRTNSPSLFGSLGTADFSSWPSVCRAHGAGVQGLAPTLFCLKKVWRYTR